MCALPYFMTTQGGVVCQNRAAPRAPVKLMSNIPETARQNHKVHKPPPVKTKPAPRALILYIPHEIVRKNAKNFAPAAGLFLDVTSSSAANTRQGCLQIYTAPLTMD